MDNISHTSGIYKIVDTEKHRYYIGAAQDILKRYRNHLYNLKANRHNNHILQSIFNKRKHSLTFEVLEVLPIEKIFTREQELLNEHYGKPLCINLTIAAGRPPKNSELPHEVRIKTNLKKSIALKGIKKPHHSKIMKKKFKDGLLTGLKHDNSGIKNGNCKGHVTMVNQTGLIMSLCRFEWGVKFGVNASKMSRVTKSKQKIAKDMFGNIWQLA